MNLADAVDVIRRRNAGDKSVTLHEHSAASVYVSSYYTHEKRDRTTPLQTRDTAPPPAQPDEPSGISPAPSEPLTAISLQSLAMAAGGEGAELAATTATPLPWSSGHLMNAYGALETDALRRMAVADAARCRAGLQAITAANRARWG